MRILKEKQLRIQCNKWEAQLRNPITSPAVMMRAQRAYAHWCNMLNYRRDVQARRAANREPA